MYCHIFYKTQPVLIKFGTLCREYVCHKEYKCFPPHLNSIFALPCETYHWHFVVEMQHSVVSVFL